MINTEGDEETGKSQMGGVIGSLKSTTVALKFEPEWLSWMSSQFHISDTMCIALLGKQGSFLIWKERGASSYF